MEDKQASGQPATAHEDDPYAGDEAPPPGARTMAILRWAVVGILAVAAAGAWARFFDAPSGGEALATRYQCPMHPAMVQQGAGSCPICGMNLVPFAAPTTPSARQDDGPAGLAAIDVSPARAQLAGVRSAKVTRQRVKPRIRAACSVAPDESAIAVVAVQFSGRVERARLAKAGEPVVKGQVLAMLGGTDLYTAQQTYLAAVQWAAQQGNPAARALGKGNLDGGDNALRRLGIADEDIRAVARRGRPLAALPLRSPVSGYVARTSALPGLYVQPGAELFRIADLSRVWIVADVPERDAGKLQPGQRARFSLPALPGASFAGQLGFVYPAFDLQTRTLQIRMELPNPGLRLRPGMSGEMLIDVPAEETLAVPAEALIDTGQSQYVFVAQGAGRYQPRAVRAGVSDGSQVQILEGLSEDEVVVTSGNFLLDSESRLRAQASGETSRPAGAEAMRQP